MSEVIGQIQESTPKLMPKLTTSATLIGQSEGEPYKNQVTLVTRELVVTLVKNSSR